MNYWLDGNDLVIKKLFGEKRYAFRELTKISVKEGLYVYMGEQCVLQDKHFYLKADMLIDMLNLVIENGLIYEGKEWFYDEIPVSDVKFYSEQAQERIKNETNAYIKQTLGEEYELMVDTNASAYHVVIYFYVCRNGEKLGINDEKERQIYTTVVNGKKEIPITWTELVMPHYLNPQTQEFRLTKDEDIDIDDLIREIKEQVDRMKACGAVSVSQFV